MEDPLNYGPLQVLVGTWKGDKGLDIVPIEDGTEEHSPYEETIEYTEGGDLKNAGKQHLAVVSYHQVVKRKSNGNVFHDEVGYWIWDAERKVVMRSFTIPRAVAVVAGGLFVERNDGKIVLDVSAAAGDSDWDIAQSPFMKENAKTTLFDSRFTIEDDKMTFFQKTVLEIYGKTFDHTDENTLTRI